MTRAEGRKRRADLLDVRFDHSSDHVVFGLEVVVDVASRNVGELRYIGQGRPFDALLVQELDGSRDQAISLARSLLDDRGHLRL